MVYVEYLHKNRQMLLGAIVCAITLALNCSCKRDGGGVSKPTQEKSDSPHQSDARRILDMAGRNELGSTIEVGLIKEEKLLRVKNIGQEVLRKAVVTAFPPPMFIGDGNTLIWECSFSVELEELQAGGSVSVGFDRLTNGLGAKLSDSKHDVGIIHIVAGDSGNREGCFWEPNGRDWRPSPAETVWMMLGKSLWGAEQPKCASLKMELMDIAKPLAGDQFEQAGSCGLLIASKETSTIENLELTLFPAGFRGAAPEKDTRFCKLLGRMDVGSFATVDWEELVDAKGKQASSSDAEAGSFGLSGLVDGEQKVLYFGKHPEPQ